MAKKLIFTNVKNGDKKIQNFFTENDFLKKFSKKKFYEFIRCFNYFFKEIIFPSSLKSLIRSLFESFKKHLLFNLTEHNDIHSF